MANWIFLLGDYVFAIRKDFNLAGPDLVGIGPADNFCPGIPQFQVRPVAWRYLYSKGKFLILLSIDDFHFSQSSFDHFPLAIFEAITNLT